jgi:hypothetical protein
MLNYFVQGSVINRLQLHLKCVVSGTHFYIVFGNWPNYTCKHQHAFQGMLFACIWHNDLDLVLCYWISWVQYVILPCCFVFSTDCVSKVFICNNNRRYGSSSWWNNSFTLQCNTTMVIQWKGSFDSNVRRLNEYSCILLCVSAATGSKHNCILCHSAGTGRCHWTVLQQLLPLRTQ